MIATQDRRYCADCRRWVFTFVPVRNGSIESRIVFRPGTTKVRTRGTVPARRQGKRYGYLCDDCATKDGQ